MTERRSVLVVTVSPELRQRLETTLCSGSWQPTFVSSFSQAKRHLDVARPQLLISEIKLGAYNGLHLAVRSLAVGIPAITLGDSTFSSDAEQLGATWLSPTVASDQQLCETMERIMDHTPAYGPIMTSSEAPVTGDALPPDSIPLH
jgi:DNA-binding NtrC family response regulator